MKNTLNTILILCLFNNFQLIAQVKETKTYNKFVGGSIGFSKGKSAENYFFNNVELDPYLRNTKYNVFMFLPTIGFQMNEQTLIGFRPAITIAKETAVVTIDNSQYETYIQKKEEYGIGLFLRHNIKTIKNFSIGIEPCLNFSKANVKYYIENIPGFEDNVSYYRANIDVSPILSYQISPRFRLLTNLGNISYTRKAFIEKAFTVLNSSSFNLNFGFENLRLGGEFLF